VAENLPPLTAGNGKDQTTPGVTGRREMPDLRLNNGIEILFQFLLTTNLAAEHLGEIGDRVMGPGDDFEVIIKQF
jgi:hypothetical protein